MRLPTGNRGEPRCSDIVQILMENLRASSSAPQILIAKTIARLIQPMARISRLVIPDISQIFQTVGSRLDSRVPHPFWR